MISNDVFRTMAMAFENVMTSPHFEKESFRINGKKIFATLDVPGRKAVVKLSPEEQSVFCMIDEKLMFPATGAWGKQGWTVIDLTRINKSILADALQKAYQTVAAKKGKPAR